MIEVPGDALKEYLSAYRDNVAAVYLDREGRARATSDLGRLRHAGTVAWTSPRDARRIARHIAAHGGSIVSAAVALGVMTTSHEALLARVGAAVAAVDAALAQAKEAGHLTFLNRAYRDARRNGTPLPRYGVVYARLRRVVFARIVAGCSIQPADRALIAECLNDAGLTPARAGRNVINGHECRAAEEA